MTEDKWAAMLCPKCDKSTDYLIFVAAWGFAVCAECAPKVENPHPPKVITDFIPTTKKITIRGG